MRRRERDVVEWGASPPEQSAGGEVDRKKGTSGGRRGGFGSAAYVRINENYMYLCLTCRGDRPKISGLTVNNRLIFCFPKKDSYTGYLYYLLLRPFNEYGFMKKRLHEHSKGISGLKKYDFGSLPIA